MVGHSKASDSADDRRTDGRPVAQQKFLLTPAGRLFDAADPIHLLKTQTMQTTTGILLSLLVLLLSSSSICLMCLGATVTAASECRCVPDQWEGVLDVVEREFEQRAGDGQGHETRNRVAVHYDFVNRRFATHDLKTGRKSLADYRLGVRFNLHRNRCRAVYSAESMRRMCFPDGAIVVNSVTVGAELAVNIWNFVEPHNATVTTTATRSTCIPIIEDITVTDKDYTLLSSTLYTDVTIGISDSSVFDLPKDCVFVRIPGVISMHDDDHHSRQKRHLSWRSHSGSFP